MNLYTVFVTGYQPYPVKKEYTIPASDYNVAISRAVKKFRKEKPSRKCDMITLTAKKARL
jgi:hypothetical protein